MQQAPGQTQLNEKLSARLQLKRVRPSEGHGPCPPDGLRGVLVTSTAGVRDAGTAGSVPHPI